jgi:hypothetical protein
MNDTKNPADQRKSHRLPVRMTVECRRIEADDSCNTGVVVYTRDLHSRGLRLAWKMPSRPKQCAICGKWVDDHSTEDSHSTHRLFGEACREGTWFEIKGLDRIAEWDGERNVYGRVMWFLSEDEGKSFQAGLKFHRSLFPIGPEAVQAFLSPQEEAYPPKQKKPEILRATLERWQYEMVSEMRLAAWHHASQVSSYAARLHRRQSLGAARITAPDLQKWRASLAQGEKNLLVIDEDPLESPFVLSLAQKYGFQGRSVVGSEEAVMSAMHQSKPKIIVLNPVFGAAGSEAAPVPSGTVPFPKTQVKDAGGNGGGKGVLDMAVLEMARSQFPDVLMILLMEERWQKTVMDDIRMKAANWLFIKPLELIRLKELMDKLCS